jgi:four helix bundle protein
VPSNVAEGSGRSGPKEYARFVGIAAGSLAEVRSLLELARRFGYVSRESQDALDARADQVAKMLHGLIRALRTRVAKGC